MAKPKKVCMIGSGNWATVVARIVAQNAEESNKVHDIVTMYVYEDMIKGKSLVEIINENHENVKYLPGITLPSNIYATANIVEAAKDADAIIFSVPNQRVHDLCATLIGKIKPTACALSMVKGFEVAKDGGIELVTSVIHKLLRINVSALMGANIPLEVAAGHYTEAVLGCTNKQIGIMWTEILSNDDFKVVLTEDTDAVEIYSGLKDIVAIGAGMVDGLTSGDNTKAVIIRLGIMEMIKFVDVFYPGSKLATFFEGCGIADLISSCYGGRSQRFGVMLVESGKNIQSLEEEFLDNNKLYAPATAKAVNCMLKERSMEFRFPILTAIHLICQGEMRPEQLVGAMRTYPEATLVLHNTSY